MKPNKKYTLTPHYTLHNLLKNTKNKNFKETFFFCFHNLTSQQKQNLGSLNFKDWETK